jgi:glycosyltransferase involved in cell wall biosynthesis
MKKSVAIIASTGKQSGFPPAPHLLEELFGKEFETTVVTTQTEPEPSKLYFIYQLFRVTLFKPSDVIHTFGTFGALLVLFRRIWDAGAHWVHTPPVKENKFETWFHKNVFSKLCDHTFEFSESGKSFEDQLSSADSEIDKIYKLYKDCCRTGIVVIAPIATHMTGGLQKQIRLQCQDLDASKYQVYLLQRNDSQFSAHRSEWPPMGIWQTYDPFNSLSSRSASKKALRDFLFLTLGFVKLIRFRKRFDLIHAYQLYTSTTLGILARFFLKKPLVVKVTASGYSGEKRTLSTLPFHGLRIKSFSNIDRVIVLSHEMSAEMREIGFEEDKLSLIPNGVNITGDIWKDDFGPQKFKIFYAGRLSNDKCVEHILEAAQLLAKRGYKLEIDLVGGPNYQQDTGPKLKAMAYSIRKNVIVNFFGEQKNMASFYCQADCFILPSKSEGLSNSLLEAQSYGTPCIVSDILPNRFIVTDEVNGLLFRQGNPNDLAKKIEILIADKFDNKSELSNKLSASARKNILDRFSNEHVTQKLEEVYEALLKDQQI